MLHTLPHLDFQITYAGTEKSGGHHGHSHSAENMNMRGEFDSTRVAFSDNNVPSQEFSCM